MEKPTRRTIEELQHNFFVDYLFTTYEPKKNSAGEYFYNGLDYLTNEISYMSSDTERQFIEKFGLAPIGFLEMLRVQMAKTNGFGICISNNDLKKAMSNIAIDYGLTFEEMQKYFDDLVEYKLLIIISDKCGIKYATTIQQVFNWEYKMWTRWTNNQYQKKKRGKKNDDADVYEEDKLDADIPTEPAPGLNTEDIFDDESGDVEEDDFFG